MSDNSKGNGQRVAIIGGGVIGGFSAYFLQKSGFQVTILDRAEFGAACSHGNCGYVSPSHILPLPQPGAVKNTIGALLKSNSPLSIKPRFSPAMWSWFWNFTKRCNKKDMMSAGSARHSLLQSSMNLYKSFVNDENIECEWQERGLLFVFHSRKEFEEYASVDRMLQSEFGVGAKPYPGQKLNELEPALKDGIGGAWHYESDCHLRPDKLMNQLRELLINHGVEIVNGFEVDSFVGEKSQVRAVRRKNNSNADSTSTDEVEADCFLVATGAMTPFLNKHLGCNIPIQPGKGYSITMPHPEQSPKIPMIFEEHRVAITPMQTGYRIGSTMEFAGYDTSINPKRLALLRKGAEHYLKDPYCDPIEEEWYGWRPMTWDGKPIIDQTPKYKNVWMAAGHNMLGLSMATGTGKLVSELMTDSEPHIDPEPYSVKRF